MHYRLLHSSPILLLFCWLTSGSGCAVLNIPSYRADYCTPAGADCFDGGETISEASGMSGQTLANNCEPGFLPPLPMWLNTGIPAPRCWAEWKANKDLPEPAPYPRFQPLPTRPMFSSRGQDVPLQAYGGAGGETWPTGIVPQPTAPGYGHLP